VHNRAAAIRVHEKGTSWTNMRQIIICPEIMLSPRPADKLQAMHSRTKQIPGDFLK
jgi:hypothetical protein